MKYTKKQRDLAILICDIAASTSDLNDNYGPVADGLGIDWRDNTGEPSTPEQIALDLALDAWFAAPHGGPGEQDAEAAALLREGWVPA